MHRCGNEAGVKSRCKPHNDGAFVLCDTQSRPLARASTLEALSLLLGLSPGQIKLYPKNNYQPGKLPEELTGQHPDAKDWSPSNSNGTAAKVAWGYSGAAGAMPVPVGGKGAGEAVGGAGGSVGVLLDSMGRAGAGVTPGGLLGYGPAGYPTTSYTGQSYSGTATSGTGFSSSAVTSTSSSSSSSSTAKQRVSELPPLATAAPAASPAGYGSYSGYAPYGGVSSRAWEPKIARQMSPGDATLGDTGGTSYTHSDWGRPLNFQAAAAAGGGGAGTASPGAGGTLLGPRGFGVGSGTGAVQGVWGTSAPLLPWPPVEGPEGSQQ